jgi:hypothetical protein
VGVHHAGAGQRCQVDGLVDRLPIVHPARQNVYQGLDLGHKLSQARVDANQYEREDRDGHALTYRPL